MNFGGKSGYPKRPAAPQEFSPFDGVLLVNKTSGPTSHDVVDSIRRRFRFKKVGHGGTLDPQATGLLIILLGKGTKLSNHFLGSDKTYEGRAHFGISTDSQDADGTVTKEVDASALTVDQVEEGIKKFKGDMMQMPPMVSAIKVNGVPLYKSARKGKDIKREPRFIHIYDFRVTAMNLPEMDFVMKCTKGTYVRTICSDLGDDLGCGAHLSKLNRTQSGDLKLEDAVGFGEVMEMTPDQIRDHIISIREFASLR
jgi:tRNA pseudouridine55 synthase